MSSVQVSEELFNAKWSVYQKVVAADYMLHRHFTELARIALHHQAESGYFTMLDIGCGDASSIHALLLALPLKSYTGYDLSATALQDCAANLTGAPYPLNLAEGDMELLLASEVRRFDLVYSSYAIHHLPDSRKKGFFKLIADRLNTGGRFIYIDIYRQEDQSQDDYRESYANWIRMDWSLLSETEKTEVISHLQLRDFPASARELTTWALDAGLKTEFADFENNRHLFISFRKI